jgi:hypothetical protein
MDDGLEKVSDSRLDGELFAKLPSEALPGRFAFFDLAPGEFPFSREATRTDSAR